MKEESQRPKPSKGVDPERRPSKATRIKFYLDLSAQLHKEYWERCALEWKVHLGIWTVLLLLAYAIVEKGLVFTWLSFVGLIVFLIAVILFHAIWYYKIIIGELRDQLLSKRYRSLALSLLELSKDDSLLDQNSVKIHNHDIELHFAKPNFTEQDDVNPKGLKLQFGKYKMWTYAVLGMTVILSFAIIVLSLINLLKPPEPAQTVTSQTVTSQTVTSQTVTSQTVTSQTVTPPGTPPASGATTGTPPPAAPPATGAAAGSASALTSQPKP